jgi:hypothetical protein
MVLSGDFEPGLQWDRFVGDAVEKGDVKEN